MNTKISNFVKSIYDKNISMEEKLKQIYDLTMMDCLDLFNGNFHKPSNMGDIEDINDIIYDFFNSPY